MGDLCLANLKPHSVLGQAAAMNTLCPNRPRIALPASTGFTPAEGAAADVVPKTSISAHPALLGTSIRCGPRNTMNGHTRLIQKRRHGFLRRKRSRTGRKILMGRRQRGRKDIAD